MNRGRGRGGRKKIRFFDDGVDGVFNRSRRKQSQCTETHITMDAVEILGRIWC